MPMVQHRIKQHAGKCKIMIKLALFKPESTEPAVFSAELFPGACTDDSEESEAEPADWLSRRSCRRFSILLCSIDRKDGRESDAVP